MPLIKQFNQLDPINNGTTAQDNFKLSDAIPAQHTDLASGVNKLVHRTFAQSLCEPVAVCNSNNPQNGAYVATCLNYPDFALSYQDAQQNTQYLIGLKIRVIFTYGITYGSVSDGTYPTLNINGSGAIPMLAQGKTMATGSASAGQTLEFTVIPYGNGIAFDADSNVRESTSDYTIYTDGNNYITPVYIKIRNKLLQAKSTSGGWLASDFGLDNSYILVNGFGSIYDSTSSAVRSAFDAKPTVTYGMDGSNTHLFTLFATNNNLVVGNTYKISGDIFCLKINSFKIQDIQ